MLSLLKKHFSQIFVGILIIFGIILIYSSKQIFAEIDKSNPSIQFVNSTRTILIIGIVFLMIGVGIIMCEKSCKDCKIISFSNDTQNYYIISSLFISIIGFFLGYTIKNEKLGPDSIYWGNLITITMFISTLFCSYFIFKKYKSQITSRYKNIKNKVFNKDDNSSFDDFSMGDDDDDDDYEYKISEEDSGDESDFGKPSPDGLFDNITFGNQEETPGSNNVQQSQIRERTAAQKAEDEKRDQDFWDMLNSIRND